MTIEKALEEMEKISDGYCSVKVEATKYHDEERRVEFSVYGYKQIGKSRKAFWSKEAGNFVEALDDWRLRAAEYEEAAV